MAHTESFANAYIADSPSESYLVLSSLTQQSIDTRIAWWTCGMGGRPHNIDITIAVIAAAGVKKKRVQYK